MVTPNHSRFIDRTLDTSSAVVSFHSIDAADFRDGGLDQAVSLLDADERKRAARLSPAGHRARWIVAHALQRHELATFLRCPPQAVRYRRSPLGRPSLAAPVGVGDGTDFNISHSGDLLLLGITRRGRIGVDVEGWATSKTADRTPLWETLADREREWVAGSADPFAAFIRLWTRKEAVVKALGTGLPDDIRALDVLIPTASPSATLPTPWGATVRVIDLPAPPGYHAAAALTAPELDLRLFTDATVYSFAGVGA